MAVELLAKRGMMFRTGTQYHPPLAIPPFTLISAVVQKGSYEAVSLTVGNGDQTAADWVGRVQGEARYRVCPRRVGNGPKIALKSEYGIEPF